MTRKKSEGDALMDFGRDGADDLGRSADGVATTSEPATDGRRGAGFCVYLGPSIRGVVTSGAVFAGACAEAVASLPPAARGHPLIERLIVDGATLSEDRMKVKTPGNLLYVNYHRLANGRG